MAARLDDPSRPARSITLHYLRPPQPAPMRIDVVVERSGRTLSTLTARLSQGDRLCVIAIGAFAGAFPRLGGRRSRRRCREVPPARDDRAVPRARAARRRSRAGSCMRGAIGAPPFSGADEALTGGWMSLHEPQPLDAAALALYADALAAGGVHARSPARSFAPTIDLTIHFRNPAAAAAVAPDRADPRRLPLATTSPTA